MSGVRVDLMSGRDRALLRAVAADRCQISLGLEPVLYVDGRRCADAAAAHRLITAGLIYPPEPGAALQLAELTPIGRAAI
jgi:hypothetical protein